MALRANWETFHKLGEEIARDVEPVATFEEIGRSLGISKQQAWHLCMVALGKLAYQLRKQER